MENRLKKLEIEVLTPVHIGNGNTISGIDYFCYKEELEGPYDCNDDGTEIKNEAYLYKFRINDFRNILEEDDRVEFDSILEAGQDTFKIRNFIYDKLENNKDKYKESFLDQTKSGIFVTNTFYKNWKEKIKGKMKQSFGGNKAKRKNEFSNQLSQLHIGEFVNSMGRYYIPGSSLKGAIRTVLTVPKAEKVKTESDVFKKMIVRDSSFADEGYLGIGKIARQSNKGEGQYAEFMMKGTKLLASIGFKSFIDEKKLIDIDISEDSIVNNANVYLKNKIEKYIKEIKLLKQHPDIEKNKMKEEKLNTVVESFEMVLEELKTLGDNEFILNIGFGGGYWFKCFDDNNETHPSKMRIKHFVDDKINIPRTNWTTDLQNLGFIKCKFID